jgi:hypothetical protein
MPEMISLVSIVVAGRDHYLNRYRPAIRDYRARYYPSHPEVMLEPNGSTTPIPYRYFRVDLASGAVSPPNLTDINVDPHEAFAPSTFAWDSNLKVTLHPFVWNGIEFVSGTVPDQITLLTDWVSRWLDIGDTKPEDNDGLSEVIHSVTFPKVEDLRWSFSVDFGSAPVRAFEDLLDTLSKLRIKVINVGSFTYLEGRHN